MRPKDLAALFVLAALWGGSFLFMRIAVPVFGPVALAAMRVTLAGLALLLYSAMARKLPTACGNRRRFVLLGVLNAAIPYALIATAELHLTASLTSILNAITPLCTAIVAAIWLRERLTRRLIAGGVLGIAGVAVLVGGSALPSDTATALAVGAGLLAAVSYGLAAVYTKVAFRGLSPLTLATGQQVGAAVVLVPLAVPATIATAPTLHFTGVVIGAVIALALLSTSVAYLLYFSLIASVGPTGAASVTLLVPVFGLLWGALLLREPLHPGTLVGLAIVLASVALITGLRLPAFRSHAVVSFPATVPPLPPLDRT